MVHGTAVDIKDVTPPETVEIILTHNYPLKYTRSGRGEFSWVITQNTTSTRSEDITHMVGRLSSVDLDKKKIYVYGGPYAGEGMSRSLVGRGIKKEASAEIPLNYIVQMWLLKQIEVPIASEKYGRLSTQRIRVRF